MRKLVTVQKIADVQPIENADAIEKVQINNWWVVTKKGEFKVGDKCLYFEIDSFLPIKPEYEFLLRGSSPKKMLYEGGEEKEGIRLKTVRLRGQISQGLALPVPDEYKDFDIDTDVSDLLGVIKYEPPVPAILSGLAKGGFPSFLRKTDEERLQNCPEILLDESLKDVKMYISSKLDGTSATYYKYNGEFGVCSRSLELAESDTNTHWKIAKQFDIANRLPDGFAIQGEIVGEKIQNNRLKIKGHDLYVFNVYDIISARFLDYYEFVDFVKNMGLKTVPIITDDFSLEFKTFDDLMAIADEKSPLCDFQQEGIVIRPLNERIQVMRGIHQRLSFKVISNKYLLEHGE